MSEFAVEARTFRQFNDRLRAAMRPIQCLQALRWPIETAERFLAGSCKDEPTLGQDSYPALPFDAVQLTAELGDIRREAERAWPTPAAGRFLDRRCEQAMQLVGMLRFRGLADFGSLSRAAFNWCGKSSAIETAIAQLTDLEESLPDNRSDSERYEAYTAASLLAIRLAQVMAPVVAVAVDPEIAGDAVAGRTGIRLRHGGEFTHRDLNLLEVHEAWIHFVTTENAARQPYVTALTRGNPQVWRTQEGLAVLAEVAANVSSRERVRRIRMRFEAVHLADQGADFRTIHRHFLADNDTPSEAFRRAMRIVRGAYPAPGAFFKDACYAAGLLQVARYVDDDGDLAVLTAGKAACEETSDLMELAEFGWLNKPTALPAPLRNHDQLKQSARQVLGNHDDSAGLRISNAGYFSPFDQCQPARP